MINYTEEKEKEIIWNAPTSYNTIIYDINSKKFVNYDIIPYLLREFKKLTKTKQKDINANMNTLKEFVLHISKYQFWSRCEYEVILQCWPVQDVEQKIDVFDQIKLNIDNVCSVFRNAIAP